MKTVISYLNGFKNKILLGVVIKIFGTVAELFIPFILSYVLDNIAGKNIGEVVSWGALMIVCATVSCVLNVTSNRMSAKVSRWFVEDIRRDLFAKTLKLSAPPQVSFVR